MFHLDVNHSGRGRGFNLLHACLSLSCLATCNSRPVVFASSPSESDERLRARANAWMQAFKDGDYDTLVDMRSSNAKKSQEERDKLKDYANGMKRGIRIESWTIEGVEIQGKWAEVHVLAKIHAKETDITWSDYTEPLDLYWTYEKRDWFTLTRLPTGWKNSTKK